MADTRIIFGVNPVLEAIRAERTIHHLYLLKGKEKIQGRIDKVARGRSHVPEVEIVTAQQLQQVVSNGSHQGVAAEVDLIPNCSLSGLIKDKGKNLTVLLLDGVEDPGNLGAIYRVADAAGVDLVFLPSKGSASHQLGTVAKSSAGAVDHVNTVVVSRLNKVVDELKGHGFTVIALEGTKGARLPEQLELKQPVALIVGSEGRGVSNTLMRLADRIMKLPMAGRVNSLNVATATAVALYEIARVNRT